MEQKIRKSTEIQQYLEEIYSDAEANANWPENKLTELLGKEMFDNLTMFFDDALGHDNTKYMAVLMFYHNYCKHRYAEATDDFFNSLCNSELNNSCAGLGVNKLGKYDIMRVVGANNVTGENATIIGLQMGMSENFVRDMLAEKDKQIKKLMELLDKTK